MKCRECGTESDKLYAQRCFSCSMVQRNQRSPLTDCPKWLSFLSNRTLPPFFFLLIGVLSLVAANMIVSEAVKANIRAVGVISSAYGFYILGGS